MKATKEEQAAFPPEFPMILLLNPPIGSALLTKQAWAKLKAAVSSPVTIKGEKWNLIAETHVTGHVRLRLEKVKTE